MPTRMVWAGNASHNQTGTALVLARNNVKSTIQDCTCHSLARWLAIVSRGSFLAEGDPLGAALGTLPLPRGLSLRQCPSLIITFLPGTQILSQKQRKLRSVILCLVS